MAQPNTVEFAFHVTNLRIMVEVYSILAIGTKEIKQNRANKPIRPIRDRLSLFTIIFEEASWKVGYPTEARRRASHRWYASPVSLAPQ